MGAVQGGVGGCGTGNEKRGVSSGDWDPALDAGKGGPSVEEEPRAENSLKCFH